jgi:DNA topoisomerase-1
MPRLRRSDSSGPGIHRIGAGRGFRYRDERGGRVTDPALLDRIAALAIPPAWTEVWIAPYANGHIQAAGVDAAGRRQYLYHPSWRAQKDRAKFDRALALAESLPVARRGVTVDLRREGLPRERVLAAAFRMLDTGSLRVGSERYADEHGSYGLSTLLGAHAAVDGDEVRLHFPAKSGLEWRSEIRDADLAALMRLLMRRGGRARLLAWREGERWHPVSAVEINDDVRERTGGDFTAKDFRTLHGTIAAAASLAQTGPRPSPTARRRAVAEAMRVAAAVLGNTPAVARASYVDPRVLDHYDQGRTIDPRRLHAAESELRALLFPPDCLRDAPGASE